MIHSSEPDEVMQGVLNDQSPQYDDRASQRDSHVTYIQYGSKNVKYQLAVNGPADIAQVVQQEPSVGTFVEEGQASRQALSGSVDPNSTIKRDE